MNSLLPFPTSPSRRSLFTPSHLSTIWIFILILLPIPPHATHHKTSDASPHTHAHTHADIDEPFSTSRVLAGKGAEKCWKKRSCDSTISKKLSAHFRIGVNGALLKKMRLPLHYPGITNRSRENGLAGHARLLFYRSKHYSKKEN